MNEFFHMGGYGFYVWVSYLLTLVVMAANAVIPLRRERDLLRRIARREQRRRS